MNKEIKYSRLDWDEDIKKQVEKLGFKWYDYEFSNKLGWVKSYGEYAELEIQIDNVGLYVKENDKYVDYIANINHHLNYITKTIRALREDIKTLIKIKAIGVY